MNDFLRNLRSSHKNDNTDPKRNLDGHYYPKEDRRKTLDRRTNYPEGLSTLLLALQDALPLLADNSNEALKLFRQFAQNNDLITQARIKEMKSISNFFDHLNSLFANESALTEKQSAIHEKPVAADYIVGGNYTKKDILDIIRKLRKEDKTFAVIAEYLTDRNIPTFSGKGKWHAQTIHRLCK